MKRRGIAAAVVATAALLVGGVSISASASASGAGAGSDGSAPSTSEPPNPPWVNADGTVDNSKMPDSVPVVGPDGEVLKNAQGGEVQVNPRFFEPKADPSAVPTAPGEKRWSETDGDGQTVEHVEVEPTVPVGN